jgi:leucyl/phenylalanyl-tRNA--protein transferase
VVWGATPAALGPSRWRFPPPEAADPHGLVAVGGDLDPATLVTAYSRGLFPMPVSRRRLGWWSPDPRGVLPLRALRVTRSMRRSARRYRTTVDACFAEVMEACGRPDRTGGWITAEFVRAYTQLHRLGYAHSVETWEGDVLVGGLYGVRIGRFFAGESMFHDATDASKVALMALVEMMLDTGMVLLDVQWTTDHLVSLGAVDVPRHDYLDLLADAIAGEPVR